MINCGTKKKNAEAALQHHGKALKYCKHPGCGAARGTLARRGMRTQVIQ